MGAEQLVVERGPLLEAYRKLEPATIQHSDELMADRLLNVDLRFDYFCTADFPMYTNENDDAFLYLARRTNHLAFQNIEEAAKQLRKRGFYLPESEGIQAVIDSAESGKTVKVRLANPDLTTPPKIGKGEWCYFEIHTTRFKEKLNPQQMALAERAYGAGENLEASMAIFREAELQTVKITVLDPKFVLKHTERMYLDHPQKGSSIGRLSVLSDFHADFDFEPASRDVRDWDCCLRGSRSF